MNKDSKLCNFLAVLLVCAWFLLAGVIIFVFTACANYNCYAKRYGENICDSAIARSVE